MKNNWLRWSNLLSVVVMVGVNMLANIIPFNGITTAEVSALYPVLFTPAGYVFAIWGLIYLALIGFSIYQLSPQRLPDDFLKTISPAFICANLANSAWIVAWHYQIIAATVPLMAVLLFCQLWIYLKIVPFRQTFSARQSLFIVFPFSLYLGWISVATIANVSVWLFTLGWNGFGLSSVVWTMIMLTVGTLLGVLMLLRKQDMVYTLVLIWAFAGIQFKPQIETNIGAAAGLSTLVLILVLTMQLLKARQAALVNARKHRDSF